MSCWVVPMVAAEMWGVAVALVLEKVKTGEVPSKNENGFLFIDVAPDSPRCDPPKSLRPVRPPTYVAVTGAEQAALAAIDSGATPVHLHKDKPDEAADDTLRLPHSTDDWRTGRRNVSRTRRAPSL